MSRFFLILFISLNFKLFAITNTTLSLDRKISFEDTYHSNIGPRRRTSPSAKPKNLNKTSNKNSPKKQTAGNMQSQVEKNQAPKSVDRVDTASEREKPHIHFDDGSALNQDGTWKEKGRELTNKEKEWIEKNGWELPKTPSKKDDKKTQVKDEIPNNQKK